MRPAGGKNGEGNTIAIYHLSVKTISRSAGRSATAAAAYRAGSKITDQRTGEIHDYTRKGGVESVDLVLPIDAPEWATDRAAMWNAAEQAETRKNSTVAREFEISLPEELDPTERRRLALDFATELVQRHGCAADVAIHAPGKDGDHRNHHAHILLTTRRLGPDGFTQKTRELDDKKTGPAIITEWRARYAELQNAALEKNGSAARVDHRSLAAQGLDRVPTRHLGPAASSYERRTGQPSRKRQDYDQEVTTRLMAAKEAGEIERQRIAAHQSIIVLSGDLAAARAEQQAEHQAKAAEAQQTKALETASVMGKWMQAHPLQAKAQRLCMGRLPWITPDGLPRQDLRNPATWQAADAWLAGSDKNNEQAPTMDADDTQQFVYAEQIMRRERAEFDRKVAQQNRKATTHELKKRVDNIQKNAEEQGYRAVATGMSQAQIEADAAYRQLVEDIGGDADFAEIARAAYMDGKARAIQEAGKKLASYTVAVAETKTEITTITATPDPDPVPAPEPDQVWTSHRRP